MTLASAPDLTLSDNPQEALLDVFREFDTDLDDSNVPALRSIDQPGRKDAALLFGIFQKTVEAAWHFPANERFEDAVATKPLFWQGL